MKLFPAPNLWACVVANPDIKLLSHQPRSQVLSPTGNEVVKPHSRVVRTITTKTATEVDFGQSFFLHFLCETSTWNLESCRPGDVIWRVSMGVGVSGHSLNQSVRVIFQQSFSVVTPYWWATIITKKLSKATIPLCFGFFRCRVHVLQS